LKKKHNAITYHRSSDACAADVTQTAKEDGLANLAATFNHARTKTARIGCLRLLWGELWGLQNEV
jgi:hypothetical protein